MRLKHEQSLADADVEFVLCVALVNGEWAVFSTFLV